MQKLTPFTITETDRGYYGGNDGRAINRHSYRDYSLPGLDRVIFTLDRNLSACPPSYEIQISFRGVSGIVSTIPCDIPDGTPWRLAVAQADSIITRYATENLL